MSYLRKWLQKYLEIYHIITKDMEAEAEILDLKLFKIHNLGNQFTLLGLNFLICKLGIIVHVFTSQYYCKDRMRLHLTAFCKLYSTIDRSKLSIIFINVVIAVMCCIVTF